MVFEYNKIKFIYLEKAYFTKENVRSGQVRSGQVRLGWVGLLLPKLLIADNTTSSGYRIYLIPVPNFPIIFLILGSGLVNIGD